MALCPMCFGDHSPSVPCPHPVTTGVLVAEPTLKHRQNRISALHAACVLHAPSAAYQDVDFETINEAVLETADEFVEWIEGSAVERPRAEAAREDVVEKIERDPGRETMSPEFEAWKNDR